MLLRLLLEEQGELLRVRRSVVTKSSYILDVAGFIGEFQLLIFDGLVRFGDELEALVGVVLHCHERIRCSNLAISASKALRTCGFTVLNLEGLALRSGDGGVSLLERSLATGEGLRLDPEGESVGFPAGGNSKLEKKLSFWAKSERE